MEYNITDENGYEMLMVPRRHSAFDKARFVFLFKPNKNTKSKTTVVIRETSGCIGGRFPITCEDGKIRVVSMSGNFIVDGNVFNQRGESLCPNKLDYFVRTLDFEFDRSQYDVKFTDMELQDARTQTY